MHSRVFSVPGCSLLNASGIPPAPPPPLVVTITDVLGFAKCLLGGRVIPSIEALAGSFAVGPSVRLLPGCFYISTGFMSWALNPPIAPG